MLMAHMPLMKWKVVKCELIEMWRISLFVYGRNLAL